MCAGDCAYVAGYCPSPIRVALKLALGFFFCLLSMLLPAAK